MRRPPLSGLLERLPRLPPPPTLPAPAELLAGLTDRGRLAGSALLAVLSLAPFWADRYLLSVLTTALWFAYTGQAWNVMMGFAGQLSLGHALYVGLGAYVSAGLFVHAGLGPWFSLGLAVLVSALAGAAIGAVGFRFRVRGVYFALLTIAFAEFCRIGFDHIGALGGSAGLFLPVGRPDAFNPFDLRGPPAMFYYIILVWTLAALAIGRMLLLSRIGYAWQAVRENQPAAEAAGVDSFRAKLMAVTVSAALTAPAGVFQAFYSNNLFPEQVFSMHRSIEIIVGPIVGGIGTLFGPVLGAFVLTPAGELLNWAISRTGHDVAGLKQFCYGLMLVVIILFRPEGLWPWLARRTGLVRPPGEEDAP
jgi:branched-chain amino acid transport system permease protein